MVTKRNKRRQDGERGDGKCGNEVTWSLAERGDSPMRNVLRLETKGCPKEKQDEVGEVGGGLAWERGECLCDFPDKEGVEEEAMGNPLGNPRRVNWRGVSEMRRGEKVFVLGDLESGQPRHATPWRVPCHRIPKVIVGG